MELLHATPAAIWRLLIPSSRWLFREETPQDELVFQYRDLIYFINQDGSVLSTVKPNHFARMDLGDLLDHLATSTETFDYDDNGIFDYGSILQRMGFVVPIKRERDTADYLIEIVNTLDPDMMETRYELKKVSLPFALYHALLRCHELNQKTDWEFEHEVKRISKLEHRRVIEKENHFETLTTN